MTQDVNTFPQPYASRRSRGLRLHHLPGEWLAVILAKHAMAAYQAWEVLQTSRWACVTTLINAAFPELGPVLRMRFV